MPVVLNDNTCERASRYDEKTIVFYSYTLNGTANAQSLASLMSSLVERGYKVHLVTYGAPAGDDFISADEVERHILSNFENDGMPSSVSFLRVLGAIPAKTVVLWGAFTKRTYQCYLAAKSLGRCVVFYQTSSPAIALASGGQNTFKMYNNILCGCDAVITPCDYDIPEFNRLGADNVSVIPFYFPYDESEVSPSTVENRKITVFSSFAGGNIKKIISAFGLLHQKYDDAEMHIILMNSVPESPATDALMNYVSGCELSDCLTIEKKVLKPLRALREAGVSITYSHLEHMPQTVMESVTRGIPTLLAVDGNYSGSSLPFDCVDSGDTRTIAALLEKYMSLSAREEYREKARKNLSNDFRNEITDLWEKAIAYAEESFENKVNKAAETTEKIEKCFKTNGDIDASALKKAVSAGAEFNDVFGVMLLKGYSEQKMLSVIKSVGITLNNNADEITKRLKYINVLEKPLKKGVEASEAVSKVKKGIYSGFEICAMLAACGKNAGEIAGALGIPGEKYLKYSFNNSFFLLNSMFNNDIKSDQRTNSASEKGIDVVKYAILRFFMLNNGALKFKSHFFVRRAIKFHSWVTKPWDIKNPLEKIILAPIFARTLIKRDLLLLGKKRMNKRKVVEVDPGDTRKVQLLVLMLLLELDRICKKYNLTYYIAGGSILGAVRHKGFIPWDDDIDITMPRPDYDKFIKVAQKELPEEYYLDKDCVPFCHNRIEIRGTDFTTFWRKGAVFLDILALEGAPDDEKLRREHERKCKFWRSCMLEKARPFPLFDFSTKKKIKRYICCSILRFVPRWFIKKNWERWAKKYDPATTKDWVCLPASIYTYDQETFPKEYWGKPVYLDFEGMKLPTMSHWEDYLICHFGDYMKMPPVTTRKSHHFIYSYSLGKYGEMTTDEIEKMFIEKKGQYNM